MSRKKRSTAPHVAKCGGGFAAIPHDVIASPAFAALSGTARALLVELVARFNGWNNGAIGLDHLTARKRLGCSPGKVITCFDELLSTGFIELAEEAAWTERRAREYRLTWATSGKSPPYRQPSLAYRNWRPDAPVCRIKRAAPHRSRGRYVATDAVAARADFATDAVAEDTGPATDAVAAAPTEPQKTADSSPAACYGSGSAYMITMEGRSRLAVKATGTPLHGVNNSTEEMRTETAGELPDRQATNDPETLRPDPETLRPAETLPPPGAGRSPIGTSRDSVGRERDKWRGDPGEVLARLLAAGQNEGAALAKLAPEARVPAVEAIQARLRIHPSPPPTLDVAGARGEAAA